MKRVAMTVLVGALVASVCATSASAVKRKPLAYRYGNCGGLAVCSFEAITNVPQSKVALSASKLCSTANYALAKIGYMSIKDGKFSANKTLSVNNALTYRTSTAKVQIKGTFKKGKSVTGSFTITTDAEECAAETGKKMSFTMKYKGPYYGG